MWGPAGAAQRAGEGREQRHRCAAARHVQQGTHGHQEDTQGGERSGPLGVPCEHLAASTDAASTSQQVLPWPWVGAHGTLKVAAVRHGSRIYPHHPWAPRTGLPPPPPFFPPPQCPVPHTGATIRSNTASTTHALAVMQGWRFTCNKVSKARKNGRQWGRRPIGAQHG